MVPIPNTSRSTVLVPACVPRAASPGNQLFSKTCRKKGQERSRESTRRDVSKVERGREGVFFGLRYARLVVLLGVNV